MDWENMIYIPNPIERLTKRIDAICKYLGIEVYICADCDGVGYRETRMHMCGCCVETEGGECSTCKGEGWVVKKDE